ncbi:hypothetical protein [Beutenbergia cavernae]|uniref:hypothetical protein n=1 Tax=Beutenbergia cavernae TaxID=84757 RepID=UPI00165101A6|nr:hypothetical protein [Beutenbergia cavernae]
MLTAASAALLGGGALLAPLLGDSQLRVVRDLAHASGVMQVVALGAFAAIASFRPILGRVLRIPGIAVGALALVALPALVVHAGTAVLLAARVAFLAWALAAAVALAFRTRLRRIT